MYSRDYRSQQSLQPLPQMQSQYQSQNNSANIPIQSFEDSFSADAFMKESQNQTQSERQAITDTSVKDADSVQSESMESKNSVKEHEMRRKKRPAPDDLLLLGLIMIFLGDAESKDDIPMPLLLAILLLS